MKCRHAPPLPLNTLTLKELHMLRTLPPRSAGGGPGHARLLAALHDRPPPLRLQVEPLAPTSRPSALSSEPLCLHMEP